MGSTPTDVAGWARLMGRDLPRAEAQPLQTIRVSRNDAVVIHGSTMEALGYEH